MEIATKFLYDVFKRIPKLEYLPVQICTGLHMCNKVYTIKGPMEVSNLEVGDELENIDGNFSKITHVEEIESSQKIISIGDVWFHLGSILYLDNKHKTFVKSKYELIYRSDMIDNQYIYSKLKIHEQCPRVVKVLYTNGNPNIKVGNTVFKIGEQNGF